MDDGPISLPTFQRLAYDSQQLRQNWWSASNVRSDYYVWRSRYKRPVCSFPTPFRPKRPLRGAELKHHKLGPDSSKGKEFDRLLREQQRRMQEANG